MKLKTVCKWIPSLVSWFKSNKYNNNGIDQHQLSVFAMLIIQYNRKNTNCLFQWIVYQYIDAKYSYKQSILSLQIIYTLYIII